MTTSRRSFLAALLALPAVGKLLGNSTTKSMPAPSMLSRFEEGETLAARAQGCVGGIAIPVLTEPRVKAILGNEGYVIGYVYYQ